MNYFDLCQSIENLKHLHKQLAKQDHPDMGGRTETLQEINSEYSYVIAKLLKGCNLTEEEMETAILSSQNYRNAIDSIIGFVNITIELVGTWIWVTGNT
ncbi:MAG: hypothetical protein IPK88_07505 [Saprospiraceae bacterium]|nr:hypothetical protein [Candidatus Defluviibacterium haderslevense]